MSLEKSRLLPSLTSLNAAMGARLISPEVESSHDSPPSSPPPALLSPITLEPTTQVSRIIMKDGENVNFDCLAAHALTSPVSTHIRYLKGNLQRAIRRIIHAKRSLKREVELLDAALCEEIEVRVEQAIRMVLIEIMAAEEEMLVPSANLMLPDEDVDMVDCDDAGEVGEERVLLAFMVTFSIRSA
ncbi:hypothetical protein HD554DRAFT_2041929 [Boletus coccyginus]|nr:hypothetical protein HD554DRAFT_2041929 [Boletus coccyginus]